MSRRVYLLGVGLALVALAFVLTDALLWEPGVTAANVKRIRAGMTLAQVEAIFGRKADDCTGSLKVFGTARQAYWTEKDGLVLVWLDSEGRVIGKLSLRQRAEGGPLARLRAWLGW